jgi:hypothetical protein
MGRFSFVVAAFVVLGIAAPGALAAQTGVPAAEAQAFLGEWAVTLQGPMGDIQMQLDITDNEGTVAASVGSAMLGGATQVEQISKSGENLVLRYSIDAQGQTIPVRVNIAPAEDGIRTTFDFADGMFSASGAATRR